MNKLKLIADLHVHTVASDGAHTIFEIVSLAKKKKLSIIGISDHAKYFKYKNDYFAVFAKRTPEEYKGVRIIKSVEADFMKDGTINFPEHLIEYLDLVLAGFHDTRIDDVPIMRDLGEEKYTKILLDCITKNRIDVITHPCTKKYPLNLEKIIKVAAQKGIAVEVNNTNLRQDKTDLDKLKLMLELVKKYNCRIIANSDGHNWGEIGYFEEIEKFINQNNFDPKLFLNYNIKKLLEFINERKNK